MNSYTDSEYDLEICFDNFENKLQSKNYNIFSLNYYLIKVKFFYNCC